MSSTVKRLTEQYQARGIQRKTAHQMALSAQEGIDRRERLTNQNKPVIPWIENPLGDLWFETRNMTTG